MDVQDWRRRLACLGWKTEEKRSRKGAWRVRAASCGLEVATVNESRGRAWEIIATAALRITMGGNMRHLVRARSASQ